MSGSASPSIFPRPVSPRWQPASWPKAVQALVALAALAGIFAAVALQPWLAIGGMLAIALGIPALIVAWYYPEFGLLGLVFLGARILDPRLIEVRLPVGGGIELPDLALIGLGTLSLARQAVNGDIRLPASWALPPLLIFLWLAVLSALWAVLLLGVEFSWAMSELRGVGYFAIFLLVTWDVLRRGQLVRLLAGLFIIGLLIIGIMLIQQFVGPVPLVSGQESSTWQIIGSGSGVTRIRPPAHVLLYFLSILAFVLPAFVRNAGARVFVFGLAVFMNLALLLTFTRSQWVASVLAMSLCFLLFPRPVKAVMAALAAVVMLAGVALAISQREQIDTFTSEVNFATPLVERVESVFELNETLDSYSARTRYFQTDAALASIQENPVTGVGLGNAYRGLTSQEARTRYTRFTRFIENSYLYLPTKMGLPAMAIFGWFALTILWGGWRGFRAATDPLLRAVSLACVTSFLGILVWAFNHPLLMLSEYTIMVGLVAGISEATRLLTVSQQTVGEPV